MGRKNRKLRKRLKRQRRRKAKKQGIIRHHMTPKSRGGRGKPHNLLRIYNDREKALHRIWGLMTWKEIIREMSGYLASHKTPSYVGSKDWFILFPNGKTLSQAFWLFVRVHRLKKRC